MKKKISYIVVGSRPWNRRVFNNIISGFHGFWHFIEKKEELTFKLVSKINPKYIFFLHWSWKVPSEIIDNFECVCFHMTDVPYGRGGSPLQNLILRGHRKTKLTALRMAQDFDAGPVYMKEDLCLEGNAEEIYIRASHLSAKMINHIIEKKPVPQPQIGDAVIFQRRKPNESRIPELTTLENLHDFIRMLDAKGYPPAFIEHAGFRFAFSRAAIYNDRIVADVTITPMEKKNQ